MGQLLRGDDEIDQTLAVLFELGAGSLELLGRAGHDGDGVNVLALELLTDQRAEHLHRGARGGDLRHEVRVGLLHVLNPAGAAGGEHGELVAALELLEELGGLLHDREVGSEVRVVHNVGAEAAEGRDELAGDGGVGGHAEFLGEADTDGRRELDDDALILIVQHRPELANLIVDGDGARRADGGALAAADALRLGEHLAEAGGDKRLLAAVVEVDGADILHLGAHAHAQTL